MLRFIPLFLLAGFALEVASIIWMGRAAGVLLTLMLLVVDAFIGGSLIKSAGVNALELARSPIHSKSLQRGLAGSALARFASGVLFIIPGFCSDLLGLLLLFPAVGTWLASKIEVSSTAASTSPQRRPGYGTVIDVEAIEVRGEVEQDDTLRR